MELVPLLILIVIAVFAAVHSRKSKISAIKRYFALAIKLYFLGVGLFFIGWGVCHHNVLPVSLGFILLLMVGIAEIKKLRGKN